MDKMAMCLVLLAAIVVDGTSVPGPCTEGGICPDLWAPLCGSDGVTYDNYCVFDQLTCGTGVTRAHYGECTATPTASPCNPNRACYLLLAPVCGSDGVTYANDCVFEARTCGTEVTIVHPGPCTATPPVCDPNRACYLLLAPVCGSNGVTYANDCFFESQTCGTNITLASYGACNTTTSPAS